MRLAIVASLVLLALKISGLVAMSWFVVVAPILLSLALGIALFAFALLMIVIGVIAALVD